MKYLENEDFEDFSNCETIIKFIRIEYLYIRIDWLFNFINTRNPFRGEFKKLVIRNSLIHLKSIILIKICYLLFFNKDEKLKTNTT